MNTQFSSTTFNNFAILRLAAACGTRHSKSLVERTPDKNRMEKKIIFHNEKWWWFSLFCSRRMKNHWLATEEREKTAFTGVFQEVPVRRYHTHAHTRQNDFIISLWTLGFPLMQCSLFIHLGICFLINYLCAFASGPGTMSRQDCHSCDRPHMRCEWMWMYFAVRPSCAHSNNWYWSGSVEHWCHCELWVTRSAHTLGRSIQISARNCTEPQPFEIWDQRRLIFAVRRTTAVRWCATPLFAIFFPKQIFFVAKTKNEFANSATGQNDHHIRSPRTLAEWTLFTQFAKEIYFSDSLNSSGCAFVPIAQ